MSTGAILHINAETTWRGGENQVFLLASGMQRQRPCAVACVAGSPLAERLITAGVPVHAIPGDRGVRAQFALRRLIRELRPSLLHAHTSRAHQLCRFATVGNRLPLLVTRRVDFPLKRGPIARWKYLGTGVRFVAISQAIRDVLLAGGVPGSRITLIPSGIDFAVVDAAPRLDPREVFALPAESQVVFNVAALSDHKDQTTLLRAWSVVEERHTRAHLLIAGEGELREQLLAQIATSGLRRARLVGYRRDVPGLLKGGDLFVMSSHLEGLCTSIMDAKRCGLPVVATAAGGIPEVVRDGIDGALVAVRDAQALGMAMSRYLADDALRLHQAAAACADSTRFSAAAMIEAYLALYRDVIG